jgi:hypothetical protein
VAAEGSGGAEKGPPAAGAYGHSPILPTLAFALVQEQEKRKTLLPRPVTVTELSRAQAEVAKVQAEYGVLRARIEEGMAREEALQVR